jgi:hypothetical protein
MGELILVSREAREVVEALGSWGTFTCNYSAPDQAALMVAVSDKDTSPIATRISDTRHFLNYADPILHGRWFRAPSQVSFYWMQVRARADTEVPADFLRQFLPDGFITVGDGAAYVLVTYAPDLSTDEANAGVPQWTAWKIVGNHAIATDIDVEMADTGIAQLTGAWPVAELAGAHLVVVGAGSIGSAAAVELARYGVRKFTLVDYDRLEWHNLVRHQATRKDVGRYKVEVVADILSRLSSDMDVGVEVASAVSSANRVREILSKADVVVGATDGVESRRVISHLARQARVTAVLGCVIENGALGEVIRLRPFADHGCLQCRREALARIGAFNPEPDIDRPYGSGNTHQPMTAVGADLDLVGRFLAKIAAATVLEPLGHPDQRLPGEQMLIGLRPSNIWAPPYDLERAGEVKWLPAYPPELGCPTCKP